MDTRENPARFAHRNTHLIFDFENQPLALKPARAGTPKHILHTDSNV